jgi:hypothetical protein
LQRNEIIKQELDMLELICVLKQCQDEWRGHERVISGMNIASHPDHVKDALTYEAGSVTEAYRPSKIDRRFEETYRPHLHARLSALALDPEGEGGMLLRSARPERRHIQGYADTHNRRISLL